MSYIDKQRYLDPKFDAKKTANAILRATYAEHDQNVDLGPAISKIRYDLEEVDGIIVNTAKSQTSEMIRELKELQATQQQIKTLEPFLNNLNASYNKLDADFGSRYAVVKKLHSAGIQLQATAELSRALTWYLHLMGQLEFKQDDAEAMYRCAQCSKEAKVLISEHQQLLQLPVVQTHQTKVLLLEKQLVSSASVIVRDFRNDRSRVLYAILTLNELSAPLGPVAESFMRVNISSGVLQLYRSISGGVSAFKNAFEQALRSGDNARTLQEVFKETGIEWTEDLKSRFWSEIASGLGQKLKTLQMANQVAAKELQRNGSEYLEAVRDVSEVHSVFVKYLKPKE